MAIRDHTAWRYRGAVAETDHCTLHGVTSPEWLIDPPARLGTRMNITARVAVIRRKPS